MKTSEFQKIIKPLVKQCIKEVMFEEGILSTIVSEVVQGLEGNVIRENRPKGPTADEIHRKEELLEQLEDLEDIRDADAAVDEYERTGKAIPWEQIKEEDGLV